MIARRKSLLVVKIMCHQWKYLGETPRLFCVKTFSAFSEKKIQFAILGSFIGWREWGGIDLKTQLEMLPLGKFIGNSKNVLKDLNPRGNSL